MSGGDHNDQRVKAIHPPMSAYFTIFRSTAVSSGIVWAGLALLVLLVHHEALTSWWRWDDPFILKFTQQHAPWEYFLVPEVWWQLSPANYTPWLPLSFAFDLSLFGLNPWYFYSHQLISIWLAASAIYSLLRLCGAGAWSLAGAAVFVVGAPVQGMSEQLMTRHYIEGLVFCLIAIYWFIRALRENRQSYGMISGLFYALAAVSKEVYLPVIVLVLLLPVSDWKERLRIAWPWLVVSLAYAPWRIFMLGGIGGYVSGEFDLSTIAGIFLNLLEQVFGSVAGKWVGLAVLAATLVWGLRQSRKTAIFTVALFMVVLFPLMPVAAQTSSGPRFALVFFVVLCLVLPLAMQRAVAHWPRLGWSLVGAWMAAGLALFFHGVDVRADLKASATRQEVHGRFLWEQPASKVLWVDHFLGPFQYFAALRFLRGEAISPRVVVDEIQLDGLNKDAVSIFRYKSNCRCISDVTDSIPQKMSEWRGRLRKLPLELEIENLPVNRVSWLFGPYAIGDYFAISGTHFGKINLQRVGIIQMMVPGEFSMVLRYDSPEGWTTYSDSVDVDFKQSARYEWMR